MTAGPVPSDQDYPPASNTRPAWVDTIPVPDPYTWKDTDSDRYTEAFGDDYSGAFDGFQVTSDADPGL